MPGTSVLLADRNALWAALSSLKFGPPGAESAFEVELARRNGWSAGYAARVVREYRRFLYVAAISGYEVTPSQPVDEAWHLHLEDERHYRVELCGRILRRSLDHRPGTGSAADKARFAAQYAATLALYRETFGNPPADIWPQPGAPWTPPGRSGRRPLLRPPPLMTSILALFGAAAGAVAGQPAVAIGFGLFAVIAFVWWAAASRASRKRRSGGNCGVGCGSSDNSPDGGDASCGGGCGGD
jgi:hypothetical protein